MEKLESLASLIRQEDECVSKYNRLVSNYEAVISDMESKRSKYGDFEERYVCERTAFADVFLSRIPDAENSVISARKNIKKYFDALEDLK